MSEIIKNHKRASFFSGEINLPDFVSSKVSHGRSFLGALIDRGCKQPINHAFFVHPRDAFDALACAKVGGMNLSLLARLFPPKIEQTIKNRFLYQELAKIPPFFIRDGLITVGNSDTKGNLMAVLLYGEQMLASSWRAFAQQRIFEGIGLAQENGVKIMGLGAHTSPATLGGELLVGRKENGYSRRREVEGVGITNGNSLTVASGIELVNRITEDLKLVPQEVTVGVVGATGSVGSATSRLLVEQGDRVILNGRSMPKLQTRFSDIAGLSNVFLSDNLENMRQCDVILVVTSSTKSTIQPEHISPGTFIIDDTQPRNISAQMGEVIRRGGSLVVDGGFMQVPGYHCGFDLRLPKGVTFACLAETLILAMEGRYGDYTIGDPKLSQVKEMMELAKKHDITVAPFTWNSKPVSDSEIASVRDENMKRRRQTFYSFAV